MMPNNTPEKGDIPYREFYADLFNENIENHKSAFISLSNLLTSKETINFYIEKDIKRRTAESKENDELIEKAVESWERAMLWTALGTYNQQIIVIMVSFTENLLQTFFNCIFCRYPERMYDYILPKDIDIALKGKVDLKEILQNPTREHLISSLASRASEIAMQGKFQTSIKSLQSVTKGAFNETVLNRLLPLVEQRNRIVHELSREKLTYNDVIESFDNIIKLVEETELVAIKMNIPVSRINIEGDL